ncbi:leucine-rich repeat protein [Perkinsela sp. CCAP 1560/4]|nr:leucine-rich repeat protein [Perkinsela sp. CCAP 1560/4]|eukprot:KNH08103.1 leucine-rich repeat protein [Perkinsela sp. CCAP 1560/4]
MSTVLVVACDDGIGRCGKSTLSQQSLMALFIFGIDQAEEISGSRECPEEVCNWERVTCNADGEVEMLFWSCEWEYGTGTLGLAFLPCSMKNLRMTENALSGTIKLADLPGKMEAIYVYDNCLTGSLDLDGLPATMKDLRLSNNQFFGEVSLESLPERLQYLDIANNQLSGAICLTSLPPALIQLFLEGNHFEGSLDLTQLPSKLQSIQLCDNIFSADPTKGHLSVVGWTSTPVLGEAMNLFKPLVVFLSWRRPY